jgi:hypothetical protein
VDHPEDVETALRNTRPGSADTEVEARTPTRARCGRPDDGDRAEPRLLISRLSILTRALTPATSSTARRTRRAPFKLTTAVWARRTAAGARADRSHPPGQPGCESALPDRRYYVTHEPRPRANASGETAQMSPQFLSHSTARPSRPTKHDASSLRSTRARGSPLAAPEAQRGLRSRGPPSFRRAARVQTQVARSRSKSPQPR